MTTLDKPSKPDPEVLLAEIAEKAIIRDSYGRPVKCRICGFGIDTGHRHDERWCPVPRLFAALGWPIPEPEPPSAAATARLPRWFHAVLDALGDVK